MDRKVVIVTGGSNGMGKAIAKKQAEEGWNVMIAGRTQETLEAAKEEIETFAGQVAICQMDVRSAEGVEQMINETSARFGTIDALVNNAAGNFICPAEKLSVNGWKAVIDIVLNGTFFCSQAAGRYWIKHQKNGQILNMAATYAWGAGAGVVHSAAAKAGVLSLTRTLAVEWGRTHGIRVNAIAPGPIERTGGAEKLFESEEAVLSTIKSVPLERLGTPEEIAGLASFLLSEQAGYINGECVTMDGGQWLNTRPF
ncbi:2,4-dienoyl-CoA reductase [Bacillus swezeyi]|uniref:2,4-dienoyl-CoA reductase n=1 Tax=Bacillus swezeyi TaxID=1925020 RepID=A0A1R1QKQ4_9BACI|nr:2,4-dienoyl-CoA reductase [Bacillus swezeyi]KAA6453069.1 2,4-dienoyl-CoA reductase [Bacillus swezeyi]KAA6476312.1 2,4-dienoyl-CoA reductase [Bacillus swezeyi]MEC1262332.1 2,4-dienoyl-CoA reductase [Bacillus swezeyi]MED1741597.1 2,4-dienoyl-CoA reductase [Bacillus swezeyi]MED2926959.1 2,4-dienoyl-CoA reductase [Bacillus swezeyi]